MEIGSLNSLAHVPSRVSQQIGIPVAVVVVDSEAAICGDF